jgi:hypothetical protein
MSQDGFVFTCDPRNLDQGGVESEDKECRKMALFSPGTPITYMQRGVESEEKVARWLCIHLGPP